MDRLTQRGAASVRRHPEFPPPSLLWSRCAPRSAPTSVAKEAIPLRRLALVPEGRSGRVRRRGRRWAGGYGLSAGRGTFDIGIGGLVEASLVDDDRGLCQPEPRGFRADGLGPAVNRAKHRLRRGKAAGKFAAVAPNEPGRSSGAWPLEPTQATTARPGEARKRAMSRAGGSPKWRRYSRLNCEGLS